MKISDFILFQKEGSQHFTGYANYFNVERWECIIRRVGDKYIVLILMDGKWVQIGLFYPKKPEKVRGAKDYYLVGLIWTPEHTYFLLRDGNRYIGL